MRTIKVENPRAHNLIMGQFPFIKTIDEIHQALVETMPGIRFGLAFNETSQPVSVRSVGTDETLIDLAKKNADTIGAQDTFILFLDQTGPIAVMNVLKDVPDIAKIYCATNNQIEVVILDDDKGGNIVGLLGGYSADDENRVLVIKKRKGIFKRSGYKN